MPKHSTIKLDQGMPKALYYAGQYGMVGLFSASASV